MPNKQPPPEGARVYIIWPGDGRGHPIAANSGCAWDYQGLEWRLPGSTSLNTGHHHVLIDTELPALDREIPNDKNQPAFRSRPDRKRGSNCRRVVHTLHAHCYLGDANHVPHQPPLYSSKITVTRETIGNLDAIDPMGHACGSSPWFHLVVRSSGKRSSACP